MRRNVWAPVVVGVLLAVVAGLGAALHYAPALPSTPGMPAAGALRTFTEVLDEAKVRATTPAQWAAIARGNAVVVLNSWDFRLIPVLKRANSAVQVWVYKDLSGVRADDCTTRTGQCRGCPRNMTDSSYLSSGVGYCWLKRNHPDWLLRAASSGRPLQFRGYPDTWEADYGNRAYQRRWIQNVIADLHRHEWDGVVIDNALTTADAYGVAAKYPTDASVQAATYSALQEAGHALRLEGVHFVVNVGYATLFPGLWQRWLGVVGGLEQEFYLSYTAQPDAVGASWGEYENEVSSCASRHKVCWFHAGSYTVAVTPQTRTYALASFLLATDGRQLFSFAVYPMVPLMARSLGDPLSAMTQVGGAWRRSFVGGVAVVNPTSINSIVYLSGNYLDNSGHVVSAVSLPPASGAILRAPTSAVRRNAGANH